MKPDYIRATIGNAFTSKDFRTWGGTCAATLMLAAIEKPTTKREATRVMNEIVDAVARRLRNTRAVCRRCYIHPQVVTAWEKGRLAGEIAEIRRRTRKPLSGLDADESVVLRWLRKATG